MLTGPLPSEIGRLQSIIRLGLFSNALTGTLCTEVGLLSTMHSLELQDNRISGTVPDELPFSPLGNLSQVLLTNNELTGTIPEALHSVVLMGSNETVSFLLAFNVTGNLISDPLYSDGNLCWINSTFYEEDCDSYDYTTLAWSLSLIHI